MIRYIIIVGVLFLFGCDSENASDCFQRTGTIVRKEITVSDFTRILVNPNIEVVLKEGEHTSVTIETGSNLMNEVTAKVTDNRLILSNTNDCGFFRSLNQTKVFITAPNITEIRSGTQFDISSDGILTYDSLALISEDFTEDTGGSTTGTFHITVNNKAVSTVGNNIASFFIEGITESLNVNFASGTGRFEGADLIAQNVNIFHRGTNKIIVNPQQSIKGEIRSTGDVISVNTPPVVAIEAFFTGKLIFQNK
ncbi:head GIN domain-containing protein [Aquimarina longa]|uniref:head GIN domain-containing protein n=1 Tax=Aquimarina longa TaxID=1080221 RepID=UPI000784AFFB|nr:head GIN domain-containing protein [Aquimarina longa]